MNKFIILLLLLLPIVAPADGILQVGKIFSVDTDRNEIVIASGNIGGTVLMGQKLFVEVHGKIAEMEVIFPMTTIAVCRLSEKNSEYIFILKKGMKIYNYSYKSSKVNNESDRYETIYLYDGRVLKGKIINHGGTFTIVTPRGPITIDSLNVRHIIYN